MADTLIPVDASDQDYTLSVIMSGTVYQLHLYWNGRYGAWIADIAQQDGTPIISSITVTADWELLMPFMEAGIPPGFLYCLDMSGQGLDPTDLDLGSRVVLVYDDGGP